MVCFDSLLPISVENQIYILILLSYFIKVFTSFTDMFMYMSMATQPELQILVMKSLTCRDVSATRPFFRILDWVCHHWASSCKISILS